MEMQLRERRGGRYVSQLVEALVEHAVERVDDLDGTDRCQLIEGRHFSLLGQRHGCVAGVVLVDQRLKAEWVEILLNDAYPLLKTREGMHPVHPPNLASLLWAMGKHECQDTWKITSTCLKELSDPKRFGRLRAADMGRAVWGLHKLKIQAGQEAFLEKVQRYLQFTVDVTQREMFNEQVVEFAEGLASIHFSKGDREIMAYLVRDIAKRRRPLTQEQKNRFLNACRSIGYPIRSVTPKTEPLMSSA